MTTSNGGSLDDRMREAFEGHFIDASDIPPKGFIEVEIAGIAAPGDDKDAKGKVIDKPILAFKGATKRLILNKTNLKLLATRHGKTASLWIGKKVTLTKRYLAEAFGQRNVPVVRIAVDSESELTFAMRKKYGTAQPQN